jgi:hypothetical protein
MIPRVPWFYCRTQPPRAANPPPRRETPAPVCLISCQVKGSMRASFACSASILWGLVVLTLPRMSALPLRARWELPRVGVGA